MKHEYYYYTKEELLKAPRIPVVVLEDSEAVFKIMAREMADEIKRKNELGEKTVFICPVGPVGQYPYFVEIVNQEKIDLKHVWFINMDEYLTDERQWIDISEKLSFRGFMDREVYEKIDSALVMPKEQRIFPDPGHVSRIQELIEELGGVDICFGGIGINGHLAFNEASEDLTADEFKQLHTRVLKISPETRTANAIGDLHGALDDMPVYCVTIGFNEIYNARKVRLGCFRDWHKSVVRHAAYGQVSAHFPVTLLQNHPDALIRIPEHVADLADFR